MNNVQTCFEQHTRGCNNLQFIMARTTLNFYQRMEYPACPALDPVTPVYAGNVTQFSRMYQCISTYSQSASEAMNSTMPFQNGCKAFGEMTKCLSEGVSEDEAAWGTVFAGQAFNTTIEVMMRVCNLAGQEKEVMVVKGKMIY